jgi:hypothetical protein
MPSSATHRGGTHRRQPTSVGKCVPARVFKFLRPHGKAGARRFGAAPLGRGNIRGVQVNGMPLLTPSTHQPGASQHPASLLFLGVHPLF